jgi:hypothetical protein
MRQVQLPGFALAVGGFGIGTGEFGIMGLLPDVAGDIGVSFPLAGHVISANRAEWGGSPSAVPAIENRTTLKISRKLIFRPLRCDIAFQRHYRGP